jgi:CBS domain containing-hemolysin-like protein
LDITLIIVFLLLSAFYAGVETAYTSFDRILLEVWTRRKRWTARLVKFFADHPERFLGTTLIGNNLVNVAYSTMFAIFATRAGVAPIWILVLAPCIILIFGEILPKVIFFGSANLAVRLAALPLRISFILFSPVYIFVRLAGRMLKKGRQTELRSPGSRFYTADELQLLLHEAQELGMISEEGGQLLSRFFVLRDRKVREVMTPRTQVVAVAISEEPAQVRRKFVTSGHSKLLVYKDDLDHIIGYVPAKEFLGPLENMQELLRPVEVVPETKRVRELLKEFRRDQRHIAVVVDEHGGTEGIVTLEDILEELLGEVEDEFDKAGPICRRIGANHYLASGRAGLDLIKDVTGIEFPTGDYSTLSGYLLTELGRIPLTGEELLKGGWQYRVLKADARRVIAVRISCVSDKKTVR